MNIKLRCVNGNLYDYEMKICVKLVDRICNRIDVHKFRVGFEHPCCALESIALPQDCGEDYISDEYGILYDCAYALFENSKDMGADTYEGVADIVDTTEYANSNGSIWYDHTFVLKPEYADLLKKYLAEAKTIFEIRIAQKEAEEKAELERIEARKNELMENVTTVNTVENDIRDEGGKTKEYITTVVFYSGESYKFSERNIFDFGCVINPCYHISSDSKNSGGLPVKDGGKWYWQRFDMPDGWHIVREIIGQELQAFCLVDEFGRYSHSGIRM